MSPRPFEPPPESGDRRHDALHTLVALIDRLRAPDGCPWDRKQTLASFAPSLIEEAFEVVEAVERGTDADAQEEVGDLLMGCVLLCKIAEDEGRFDVADAANGIVEKLVRRHPHVFADEAVADEAAVHANWEAIKKAEREAKGADASAVAGVPAALPALQRAMRLGKKAMGAGFRWDDTAGAVAKLKEEVAELEVEIETGDDERMTDELGDVLLAAAFLGNYLGIDPEVAARKALARFETRFRSMEDELGSSTPEATLAEWMAAWGRAKARTAKAPDDNRR